MRTPAAIRFIASALLSTATASACADITIGVSLPLTGPASGLGIPMNNAIKLWPTTIGGERVKVIVLDDATDPSKGVQNARKLLTEEKVDILLGSAATPVAIAMADVAAEAKTVQLALSPMPLPPGKDAWTFRIPHSNDIMAEAMARHMSKSGVKTVGVLAYTDAYGESWIGALNRRFADRGIKMEVAERFARTDAGVTGQAIKLVASNTDAIVIVASGSGAAMPHLALAERGYKGKIYQTHGAASRDLMRLGGKAVDGGYVSSATVVVAEQLTDANPMKAEGMRFVTAYEKVYGPNTRNALSAHGWDAFLILDSIVPAARKKAAAGTPEFRAALHEVLESSRGIAVTGGVLAYTPTDHWGYKPDVGIIMKIVNGDWVLEN